MTEGTTDVMAEKAYKEVLAYNMVIKLANDKAKQCDPPSRSEPCTTRPPLLTRVVSCRVVPCRGVCVVRGLGTTTRTCRGSSRRCRRWRRTASTRAAHSC